MSGAEAKFYFQVFLAVVCVPGAILAALKATGMSDSQAFVKESDAAWRRLLAWLGIHATCLVLVAVVALILNWDDGLRFDYIVGKALALTGICAVHVMAVLMAAKVFSLWLKPRPGANDLGMEIPMVLYGLSMALGYYLQTYAVPNA